ncbi:Leaf rust 10 disease-resistance locus receptor-like protein kinase [Actinidia chinensis var. chinensis]|uniref:Leaf rust 10 disease-resistance locus receptor-like protein kinase n=1 Tax=Actinidia chinensis var. chinensis TaxID=1590841 RepID=A0A2R6QQQ4_ACTCC|nr:Leaf rust 10 disease-resistance locus receptor-like protein kinase [Actinidia chinensis var. chinensis]
MKLELKLGLVTLSLFSLSLSSSAQTTNTSVACPLDLGYVLRIPWPSSYCRNDNRTECCQTLLGLYGIALSKHLKETSLFRLSDLQTSIACLSDFDSKLDSLSLPRNLTSLCFDPVQFVITPNVCAGIESTRDWVARLGRSTVLDSACAPDLVDDTACDACVKAGFQVQTALTNIDGNRSHAIDCFYFTILYAAGIVNDFGPESTGSVSCIFGLSSMGPRFFYLDEPNGVACSHFMRIPDSPNAVRCIPRRKWNWKAKVATGASAAGVLMGLMLLILWYRRHSSGKSMIFWKKGSDINQKIEAILKNCGPLAPKRYSYSDVKKMTNSFKEKLGRGGYGEVYKGKLQNGEPIAVKVLNESKGDGEEFINEVTSISRTSHVNVVTLLGFCFEGHKRALIYEFMPNGSLDKFIPNDNSSTEERQLGWETLYQIAIGIARGLEYLHRGCNTRILHFDIKPQNILLDEDFCPKISDFGLAKLCPKKESIVAMLGMRGTIGYIAPEVFSRNFGGISHKSDVYSYGMMILNMVGGKNNVDVGVDHTSELYFLDWIYRHLEMDKEIGQRGVMTKEQNERARKMMIVGFWCIQTDPSSRPSMSRVVGMLEGSLETLQIPTRPALSSPPRALAADSSATDNLVSRSSDSC